jgi:hypothetical protein
LILWWEAVGGDDIEEQELVSVIAPQSVPKILAVTQSANNKDFSSDAKSAIFIKQALDGGLKCPVCWFHRCSPFRIL